MKVDGTPANDAPEPCCGLSRRREAGQLVRVPQAGSSDPFTRPDARAHMLRQLKNCRAGAAPNIEYALARLGRRQIQQLLG